MKINAGIKYCISFLLCIFQLFASGQSQIENNSENKSVKVQDGNGNLVLNINYDNKCVVDQMQIFGEAPVSNDKGIFSAIKVNENWFTTESDIQMPKVTIKKDWVIIEDIYYGDGNKKIKEKWIFNPYADHIDWTIEGISRILDVGGYRISAF